MKRVVFIISALLHIACNADSVRRSCIVAKTNYVTLASSDQPLNVIAQDTSTTFDSQDNNSAHTISVSNPITFSTQHKRHHHQSSPLRGFVWLRHTAAPRCDLKCMNTVQLTHYFNTHGYTQEQILERQDLFASAAFVALAKQLPKYTEYVKKYYEEYRNFNWYTKGVGRIFSFYTAGFQDIFTRLYKECRRERRTKETREHKNREEHAQKRGELASYRTKLEALTHDNLMLDAVSNQHQQARNKAHAHIRTMPDRVMRKHTVTQDTITFAHTYDIAEHDLTSLQGNAYEQQLHTEFLEQLTEANAISTSYALQPKNILIDAVGHGAAIGMEANRLQQPDVATAWANVGWKVFEIIEGVGEGLVLFAENTADMLLHPQHTLQQAVHGLGILTGLVARTCARAIGTASYWHELMEQGDGLLMAQEMDQVAHKVTAFGNYCKEKATSLEARDVAKYGTAIAADILLTHKMFVFGGTLCTRATPVIRDAIAHVSTRITAMGNTIANALEAAHAESPLLQTAEGILIKASEELNKVSGAAIEVLKNTRLALETVHAQYMAGLEVELGAIRSLFDNKVKGFAEFANKFLKLNYNHILGIENLVWNRKGSLSIDGFHHDFMNAFRKSGAFEFTDQVMYEHGFYRTTVLYEGKKIKDAGTFFPAEWPREKVVEKIYEAYHDFIKSGVKISPERDGKYIVNGFIKEGIEIEMLITQKGRVVTAYPILE